MNKIKFKKIDLQTRVLNAQMKAKDISRNLSEKYRVPQSSGGSSTGPNSVGIKMTNIKQRVKLMPSSSKKSNKISGTSSNSQRSNITQTLSQANFVKRSPSGSMYATGPPRVSARKGSSNSLRPQISFKNAKPGAKVLPKSPGKLIV